MRFRILLIALFSWLSGENVLNAQQTNWQQKTNYNIEVTLDDKNHTLDGRMALTYMNRSPDTLHFIWIHLWPNAYKNDKTAYAEQQIRIGNTDFYFSSQSQKGFINRLDFKVDGITTRAEDHPQFIDIVKLLLPKPLPPAQQVQVTTPFHIQLPHRFSRLGYADSFYSITQWYPKAAVYDTAGWHPIPYLDQGEFYADFGDYKVAITLPENYVVAANGMLQQPDELAWMKARKPGHTNLAQPQKKERKNTFKPTYNPNKKVAVKDKPVLKVNPVFKTKTLTYEGNNMVDFAWFAHPHWLVKFDTLALGNKMVELWNYVLPDDTTLWKNSMLFTKKALQHYSHEVGPYPYPHVSIVGDPVTSNSGMEYPMITSLNADKGQEDYLETLIVHEVGHNWFQSILANNEYKYPWLDEGLNTYLERLYTRINTPATPLKNRKRKLPEDFNQTLLDLTTSKRIDQPINTPAATFNQANYFPVVYHKTALWLEYMENRLGRERMQQIMQTYYQNNAFSHVYPPHLKLAFASLTDSTLSQDFDKLKQTGPVIPLQDKRPLKLTAFYNLSETDKYRYIGIAPAFGFNNHDGRQLGVLVHNYNIPSNRLQWVAAPLYATGSKQLNGFARVALTQYFKAGKWHHAEIFAGFGKFNTRSFTAQNGEQLFAGFTKAIPGIYVEKRKKYPLSTLTQWMELRTWIIGERTINFMSPPPPGDTVFFPVRGANQSTIIPQINMGWKNDRTLYPYELTIGLQQVKDILRFTAEGHYFFNYNATGQGIRVRAFAGKIMYLREKTDEVRIANARYHFTMQGPTGNLDYTYSQPFAERNQSAEFVGRQIMMRDGGFKYRSDFSAVRPGLKTGGLDFFDNWLAAVNLAFDIPPKINPLSVLPVEVPLKVFVDIGTSASPWAPLSEQNKFLYSAGLQLPVFKAVQLYLPLLQSKVFDEPNSVNNPNRPDGPTWWQKKVTFTVDLEQLKPKLGGVPIIR